MLSSCSDSSMPILSESSCCMVNSDGWDWLILCDYDRGLTGKTYAPCWTVLSDGATFLMDGVARTWRICISSPYSIESSKARNLWEAICLVSCLVVRGSLSAIFFLGLGRLSKGDLALDWRIPTRKPSIFVTWPSRLMWSAYHVLTRSMYLRQSTVKESFFHAIYFEGVAFVGAKTSQIKIT